MKVAWIGTGVMGKAMLLHVKDAGHSLTVYNRTMSKAEKLKDSDITVCDTIFACVTEADIIITMVGYPSDVREVYQEIFAHAIQGAICIDMTTSSPTLAKQLYKEARVAGLFMLDAPVSGGDTGAQQGTLSIMVGGDQHIYDTCYSLLSCMGTPRYMGRAGFGQHTKACNQIAVAGAVAAMSEAIVYAKANNLDPTLMLEAISGGAGGSWQIEHTAPRVLKEDFAPGFYIKHFIKDMHIIQEEMQEYAISLKMLETVCHMYETLADQGEEDAGTQALLHFYNKE